MQSLWKIYLKLIHHVSFSYTGGSVPPKQESKPKKREDWRLTRRKEQKEIPGWQLHNGLTKQWVHLGAKMWRTSGEEAGEGKVGRRRETRNAPCDCSDEKHSSAFLVMSLERMMDRKREHWGNKQESNNWL